MPAGSGKTGGGSDESIVSLADNRDVLVRFLVTRLRNREDAYDLAQEAYLRLLRRTKAELIQNPEAYLFRIAVNLVYEYWLKAQTQPDYIAGSIDPDSVLSDAMSPEVVFAHQQRIDALGRLLRVLPPMQQKVILMHRRDGMTYKEIAKTLGISTDMVKKYLSKGLARCREQLRYCPDG